MVSSLLKLSIAAGMLSLPSLLGAQTYRRVDAVPLLRIQGVTPSGELTFAAVAGATRLSDGTIVVADRITSSIHFFGREGAHLGHFGREGDGPGEFRYIAWIGTCGSDEVHVWDMVGSRLTVVGKDRRLVRQLTLPSDPGSDMEPLSVRCSPDGSFALIAPAQDSTRTIVDRTLHYLFDLVIADSAGRVMGTLPRLVAREFVRVRSAIVPKPLSAAGSFAIGRDRIFANGRDGDDIQIHAFDRGRIATVRPPGEHRPATPRHLEVATERIAALVAPTLREQTNDQLLELPLPDRLPPFGEFFLDPGGVLWVVSSAAGDARTNLVAFSEDGRFLGRLSLPAAVTVCEVGADYVLGSVEDELGQQSVVLYRLHGG